jgi:hypothetical protein
MLFFGTISTYLVTEEADRPSPRTSTATRNGIPVQVWCWPGSAADSALIRQFKDEMRDWCLSKVIWVADRGFTSAENRYLHKGRRELHHRGEAPLRLRRSRLALSRQGGYTDFTQNLKVKEVRIAEDERFIICFNPEASDRDTAVREP